MQWAREAPLSGSPPSPRTLHAAALIGGALFVYGGTDGASVFGDLFRYDLARAAWAQIHIPIAPGPRAGVFAHSLAALGTHLLIFGGHNESRFTNDVQIMNLQSGSWLSLPISGTLPAPRGYHHCIFLDNRLFVLGGSNESTCFSDLILLEFSCFSWLSRSQFALIK